METRGLTEQDAYRALQRLATDRCKKLVEVAEAVLLAAELDGLGYASADSDHPDAAPEVSGKGPASPARGESQHPH